MKKNYVKYTLYAILIGLLLWPTSRAFFQQQLMKIGFFQPKFDAAAVEEVVQDPVTFVDQQGNILSTEDLKGKVVFLNFWATWCGPCLAEMPSIQALYHHFKDNPDIVFLLVEVDGNAKAIPTFVRKHDITIPIVFPYSPIPSSWMDGTIPTTIILNKKGFLATHQKGMYDYSGQGVQEYIQSLIDQ